ncbi:regulator of G protein signaling family member locomotion defects isoform X2 [Rhodnius prolixus]|uniref:regulator of G protein signaling family member locomotion defects isoform X2 n=1 Tax=Rhodnius prolixus TaxID=13249 RepID=UPI003D18BE60
MHPVRRRKKRPNYGVRTVEVKRGQNGFGFTISGQHPCILSCIVPGSPAETSGLRAGDYLVAVEGQSVSKVPHDDVVRLIGCSNGVLKLQIAESYYSDSSDDDVIIASRQKPKYTHKSRLHGRAAKVVRDLRTGAMFEEDECVLTPPRSSKPDWKDVSPLVRPLLISCLPESGLPADYSHNYHSSLTREPDNHEILTAVVGYVGTIEMPTKLPPQSSLQVVRGCIKRLRAEKRTHTPVLMTVLSRSLRLASGNGATLAVYPKERVTFCARAQDKDDRHFGVVTTGSGHADPSSSCHVFALDPKHHTNLTNRARLFSIDCQQGEHSSAATKEVPLTSEPIVTLIKSLYEGDGGSGSSGAVSMAVNRAGVANSPQPSHDSTTTTSNSDSGIGFRDDSGNQSDRILMVEPNNRPQLHLHQLEKVGSLEDKVNFREMNASCRSRSPLSTGSEGPAFLEEMSVSSAATKSPTEDLASPYKLSPKVFPTVSQSLEDLKNQEELRRPMPGTHWGSLQDLRVLSTDCESPVHTLEGAEGAVSSWATSFEKLLDDTIGLQTFAEFLKKEFSHENIFFWVSCENYRRMEDVEERKKKAKEIFECHLDLGALEPVNVDSYARQITEEQLDSAPPDLFLQAQKQIFNLMKFDSYPRFIKSELYKECVVRVLAGEEIPVKSSSSQLQLNSSVPHTKLIKSWSDAEERCRKSLLGWAVRRGWAKSRDRADNYSDEGGNSVSSSISSLSTWDVALSSGLTRVGLPDGSTAVVPARPGLTVRDLISNLLSKRAIDMPDFNVRFNYRNKVICLDDDASSLSGQEVTVERKVVFRLDLPNRKTILVKSRGCNSLSHVLRPILIKYGYSIDMVTLCLMSENEVVEPSVSVTQVHNQRIQVLTRSTPTNCLSQIAGWRIDDSNNKAKSLDEITNRVFEELLQGKVGSSNPVLSDQGSVRSEDWGSESSSGILDRFLRCDSAFIDKQRKSKKNQIKSEEGERKSTLSKLPPLIAKLKPSSKYESRSESDVLYEGLKRAQRSRLEDQRGTEINFELPDFLKDKENTPQGGKKVRKLRLDTEEKNSKVYICEPSSTGSEDRQEQLSLKDESQPRPHCQSEPPPLPPKPKNLVPWPEDLRPRARTRRAVYLDQPSSSFV